MDILIMCKFIEFYDSNIKKKVRSENSSHFLRFSDSQIFRFSDSQIFRFSDSQIFRFSDSQIFRFYYGRSGEAVGLSAVSLLPPPHPAPVPAPVPAFRPR